jgi:hypothetical protein
MNVLRWTLGGLLVLGAGGWILLAILGGGFRKSFGASDGNPLIVILPLAAMAVLLGGVLLQGSRGLLHAGAAVAVVLAVVSVWQIIRVPSAFFVLVLLFLMAWLTYYWQAAWRVRQSRPLTPAQLTYPVLLVDEDKIAEVCLDADELTLRPENTDHVIEQRFRVIDSAGRQFKIENFRSAEPRPSMLSRVFTATVYNVKRFKVAFELRPGGVLTREQVLAQLHDREWLTPAPAESTASLAELFRAYRVDRFREYGNSRDRMPGIELPRATEPPNP